MTAVVARDADVYARRKRRAGELAERWPFAAEVLHFYQRLLDVQETAFDNARGIEPAQAAVFASDRVLPRVIEVSAVHGPATLQQGALERFDAIDLRAPIDAWLRGVPLDAIDRYLARAAAAPVLEALGTRAGEACVWARGDRYCPVCGGLPQLAYTAAGIDDLVTPHRYLECSRCASSWPFTRVTCAGCGECEPKNLLHFSEIGALEAEISGRTVRGAEAQAAPCQVERAQLPHVAIDGCGTCSRYLLTIDVRRDPLAVPVVDELAALPFYVYARERELSKIVPNQLGF